MNTMNQILSHDSESIATAMQSLKKANNWLSSFLESYSPPLDGERYLTDKELSEHLKLSVFILITSHDCQNGFACISPLQRFIAPSKDFERFINAAFLIYFSVLMTSSTFSFNFSNGLISSFVSCIQSLIL